MPGLNQTGPMGQGPRTGRGMGRCNPDNKGKTDDEILQNSEQSYQVQGRGLGRGFGLGRGRGRGFGKGLGFGRGMAMRFRGNV